MPRFDDLDLRRRIRGVTRAALPPTGRQDVQGVAVRGADGLQRTVQPKDFPRGNTIAPRDVGLRQPAQSSPRFSQTERPLVRTRASTAENADIAGRLGRFRNAANREELARGSLPGGATLGLTRPQGDPLSMRRAELQREIDQVDLSGDQSIPSLVANAARRRRLLGQTERLDELEDQRFEATQTQLAGDREFQREAQLEILKSGLERPDSEFAEFVDPDTGVTQRFRVDPVTGEPIGGPLGVTDVPDADAGDAGGFKANEAAKIQLLRGGVAALNDAKAVLFDEQGKINRSAVFGSQGFLGIGGTPGSAGRTMRQGILEAVEAKLRAESGAAVPQTEVQRAAERFFPSPADSDEAIRLKVQRLEKFLRGTLELIDPTGQRVGLRRPEGAQGATELTFDPDTGEFR